MDLLETQSPRQPVTVSLDDLRRGTVTHQTLEDAFGPSSLGILLVKDLPDGFTALRQRVLSYASYLSNLPKEQIGQSYSRSCQYQADEFFSCHVTNILKPNLDHNLLSSTLTHLPSVDFITSPTSNYLTGWSHGKEALKPGVYDTQKGSFYANCAFYQSVDFATQPHPLSSSFPEQTAPNLWPDERFMPGFKAAFEDLCKLIIDAAVLVARACDKYAEAKIEGYEAGYLERVVSRSPITKARLLHYFAKDIVLNDEAAVAQGGGDGDDWCATHVDHGCLTGLTSAMYIDEAAAASQLENMRRRSSGSALPPLPVLPGPSDPTTGLYIHARDASTVKVAIPRDHLAFQTGEVLELITSGKFRAVPHFVRGYGGEERGVLATRNTLAVFTQPDLGDVVDRQRGMTFGEFTREVLNRF